ncbi:class D sortase [Cohnella endophytica]|nr:class D sortase [Cohnella endophytica]
MKMKKRMSGRIVTVVLWFVVLVGLAMAYYPKFDAHVQEKKQLKLLSEWSRDIRKETPQSEISPASAETELPQWKTVNGKRLLGSIRIESIKLTEPIVRGTQAAELLEGAGTVLDERMPGQKGNFVLAGHRSWTFGRHFNRLGELKPGDIIDIDTTVGTYRYIVFDSRIVMPDDVSVLEDDTSVSRLTLITCDPIRKATHRLIVSAELQNN